MRAAASTQTLGVNRMHLKSLSTLGVVLNSPHLGPWPHKIGAYMLNFAGIELISYQYLNALESSRADFNKNLDRLLTARIARIVSLIKISTKLTNSDKSEMIDLWNEAKELSNWRNRIAHNPVVPTWKSGSDSNSDPPDLIGVPDFKQLKLGNITDSISLEGIGKLIDASADLAQRLHRAAAKL